jgi:hypothetical protein
VGIGSDGLREGETYHGGETLGGSDRTSGQQGREGGKEGETEEGAAVCGH